jgi:hypothetical protein
MESRSRILGLRDIDSEFDALVILLLNWICLAWLEELVLLRGVYMEGGITKKNDLEWSTFIYRDENDEAVSLVHNALILPWCY